MYISTPLLYTNRYSRSLDLLVNTPEGDASWSLLHQAKLVFVYSTIGRK